MRLERMTGRLLAINAIIDGSKGRNRPKAVGDFSKLGAP
jgi:hypothetical protein